MRIIQLTAENVKRIKAVAIVPGTGIVTIAGRNGQGKTSVLDSIEWALHGMQSVQAMPIRKGEQRGTVKLTLGDNEPKLTVERRFTEKGSALFVESLDGAVYKSPQALLDRLIGALSFDPLAFARMDARQQFEELRRVSNIEIDIDHVKAQIEGDFVRRTEVNRDLQALRAQHDAITIDDADLQPVDEAAIAAELQAAGDKNREVDRIKVDREKIRDLIADAKRRAEEDIARADVIRDEANRAHEKAIVVAREAYDRAVKLADESLAKQVANAEAHEQRAKERARVAHEGETAAASWTPLPDLVDATVIRHKLDEAREHNKKVLERDRQKHTKATLAEQVNALRTRSAELTAQIENRRETIDAAIKKAALPIAGIGFGEGCVLFDGIPFEQISSAEQLRVSMAIAMAANPRLRVIRITDGSLLDDDSLAAIGEMARDKDFQIWLERVDGSGKVGIVIEDGEVASTPESRSEIDAAIAAHPEYVDDGVRGFPGEGHTA